MRWACLVSGWTPCQNDPAAVCCRIRRATGAPHDYSSLGLTARLRGSHNAPKVGTLMPRLPVVQLNDMRPQPQTFQGGLLEMNDIGGLALPFG